MGLLFTFFLTYAGSAVALFLPFVGLSIYYCFTVLRPEDLWFYAVEVGGGYSRTLALATLAGWAFRGFPKGDEQKHTIPIIGLLIAFVISVQASAWLGVDSQRSELIASSMLKIAVMAMVGFCLVDSVKRVKILLWVFILSQGYVTFDLNLETLMSGQNIVLNRDGFGTLNNNTFALSLLPGIGLSLMTGVFEQRLFPRAVAIFCALTAIHVILLSASRGAYLGLIAIGGLVFYFMPKNRTTIPPFLLVLLIAGVLIGEPVREEFMSMFAEKLDTSATKRFDMWKAAFHIMMNYPILGVGPTNFGVFSGEYEGLDKDSAVHNLYLQTGSDCGFLGLGLLLAFYFVTLRVFANAISWKGEAIFKIDPVIAAVTTGAFAGVVGYLVHSCFSSGVIIETPYLAVMLGAAAVRLSKKEVEQAVPIEIHLAAVANA